MPTNLVVSEPQEADLEFQLRARAANPLGFVGGFPNFYYRGDFRDQNTTVLGGTVFLRAPGATFRDVPLQELEGVSVDDFAGRMKASQNYANGHGFVGAFPTFYDADYGKGRVCGTILLTAHVAEWRDVPLVELGSPRLDKIEQRFQGTQDYALQHGFVGGFPNMYHAEIVAHVDRPGIGIVCGTILLRAPDAELQDVVVRQGLH